MNLLSLFLSRSKLRITIAALGGLCSGLSTTALIVLANFMIRQNGHYPSRIVYAFAALCMVRLITGIVSHALLVALSQDTIHDFRMNLCRRIVGAPLRQLEKIGVSKLMTAFADDMLPIASAVINLPYLFVNTIVLAGCLLYLGWLSWHLLVGIGTCIALGALSYIFTTRRANRLLRSARLEQDELFQHFRSLNDGVKELKLHSRRRGEFMENLLGRAASRVRQQNTSGITLYSAAANWSRILFFVYIGLLLLWSPNRGAAELSACVIVILYMMAPIEAILNALPAMAQANVAINQIQAVESSLEAEAICSVAKIAEQSEVRWRELALIDVKYAYEDQFECRAFSIGPINLALRPGEVTFIVGGNGSGKTTLGKLIAGLYRPDSGEVHVDGEPLSNLGHQETRSMFTAVFNDFCLFDPLLGVDASQLKLANQYLRMLKLDHKVAITGFHLSTTDLSQGQRKRLALFVALLEDRPIYLFDEWAADQDPQFKEVFYGQIVPDLSRRGKAVIVITHDDRYFDTADQLLVLGNGSVTGRSLKREAVEGSIFLKAMRTRRRFEVKVSG